MELPEDVTDDLRKRLRRVAGQVQGIERMLDEGRECRDIVTQISAANRALEQAGFRLVSAGLTYCISHPEAGRSRRLPARRGREDVHAPRLTRPLDLPAPTRRKGPHARHRNHRPPSSRRQAEAAVRATLADNGFGVSPRSTSAATLKAKLGVDRPALKILGACNPTFANQALELDPQLIAGPALQRRARTGRRRRNPHQRRRPTRSSCPTPSSPSSRTGRGSQAHRRPLHPLVSA